MEIVVPHVNLNGNSKNDLLDQTLNCQKAKEIYDWETVGAILKEFTDNF